MRLRTLYALVGALIGVGLGVLAAYGVVIVGAGVSWLFIFGDDTWPSFIAWVIPGAGVLGGVIVWSAATFVAARYGRRHENAAPEAVTRQRRFAYLLLAAGVLFDVMLAGAVVANHRQQDAARELGIAQSIWFAEFLAARQNIDAIEVRRQDGQGVIAVTLRISGTNAGDHRLEWLVRESLYKKVLAEDAATLRLTGGLRDTALSLDAKALAAAYHRLALGGADANVMVDEAFVFEARLVPLLDADTRDRLPRNERQNLDNGTSELIVTGDAPLPIRFILRATTITLGP